MAKQKVTLTEPTFILGSLYPTGSVIEIDPKDYGLKSVDDTYTPPREISPDPIELAPNLVTASKGNETGVVEIAAVAPTGPNPTAPQAVPPDAVQMGDAYVSSEGDAITPETMDQKKK